jgi:hypothetical protein
LCAELLLLFQIFPKKKSPVPLLSPVFLAGAEHTRPNQAWTGPTGSCLFRQDAGATVALLPI